MKPINTYVLINLNQVDARQLGLGLPPALLPFDSLLLSHPVDPAWRRRVAESHSTRYTPALPSSATKPETSDSDAASRDRGLTIAFIGHDFDEHPTAHMMAGVFLWQKRFEDNGRVLRSSDIGGVAPVAETLGTEASKEHAGMATNVTKRTTSRRCCR